RFRLGLVERRIDLLIRHRAGDRARRPEHPLGDVPLELPRAGKVLVEIEERLLVVRPSRPAEVGHLALRELRLVLGWRRRLWLRRTKRQRRGEKRGNSETARVRHGRNLTRRGYTVNATGTTKTRRPDETRRISCPKKEAS